MRGITIFLVSAILIISGLGAVVVSGEKVEYNRAKIVFSEPKIIEENEYVTITIEKANSYLIRQNKPLLPSYTYTFEFPFGTKIKDVVCTPKNIEQKTLSKEIIKSPDAVLAGKIIKTQSDDTTTNTFYPEVWYEYDVYSGLSGNTRTVFVNVYIYPVKYHEQDKTIEWINEVDIKVEYELPEQTTVANEQYDFVIITEDQYIDTLDSFVAHKNNREITTKVVSLSDIYSGTYFPANGIDDAEEVKYFIKNTIENWDTSNIMLVGRDLPQRETHVDVDGDAELFVSDLYYADIFNATGEFSDWDSNDNGVFCEVNWGEGTERFEDELDLHPDVHLARIPCVNSNELTIILDKIIGYENSKAYSQSWFGELIAVGGDSFPGDRNEVLEGEYVNEKVISIMESCGFISERLWVTEGDLATKIQVISSLRNGAGFIDFSGHGNKNTWATHPHENEDSWLPPPFGLKSKDIPDIKNGDKLPVLIVGACSVAKYMEDDNCFCYAWLHDENGGAIATFGATALGYAYTGNSVINGLVEKIAIETFQAYKDGAITVGEMWTRAIESYIKISGLRRDSDYKTVLEWSAFGDPTLALAEESEPPSIPSKPDGQTNGQVGVEYTYSTSANDPEEDDIYYLFDWGDGSNSGWIGPYPSGQTIEASYTWNQQSEEAYNIRVKSKDIHGRTNGEWSDPLGVIMPRNRAKQFSILEKIWEIYPNLFPILKFILGYN